LVLAGCGVATTMSAGGDDYGDTRPTYSHDTKPPHTKPDHGSTTTVTAGLFSVKAFAFCGPDFLPEISITFGNRPDLDGQQGVLSFSTGGSVFLTFRSNQTVTIAYPNTTQNVNLIYSLGQETATASVTYPANCPPEETTTTNKHDTTSSTAVSTSTTSTTINGVTTTTTVTSTTINGTTTTTTKVSPPGTTTTTVRPVTPPITGPAEPEVFVRAAGSICDNEVPKIRITFGNLAQFDGQVGTLTMRDINGNVISVQPLTYRAGTSVDLLYPGTAVNPDGSIDDVPGWILTDDGFWVEDPSDAFLRQGITLTYEVNPSVTTTVTYPPESSGCANPKGPFRPPAQPPQAPPTPGGIPITE
jgi:hypothetical protein